jgi:uncharacterized protein
VGRLENIFSFLMKYLHSVTFILLVIGGLNWLLVAFGWNVVDMLGMTVAKVVYVLVGLSAIVQVATHKSYCKNCSAGSTNMGGGQSM